MTRAQIFWILMLLWLVLVGAWHFALIGFYGVAIIPFLLIGLLGWQVFGKPVN